MAHRQGYSNDLELECCSLVGMQTKMTPIRRHVDVRMAPRSDHLICFAVPEEKKPQLKELVETSGVQRGRPSVPTAIELWDFMWMRWEVPKP